MEKRNTTIIVVDDHAIMRRGIRALLEYEQDFSVVAESADGDEALRLLDCHRPIILVTDLCMPKMGGIELLTAVKKKKWPIRAIVLSMCGDAPYVTRSFRAGAWGYVLKESGAEHLVTAIREVLAGHRYISPPLVLPEDE